MGAAAQRKAPFLQLISNADNRVALGVTPVHSESTDQEICEAVDQAGLYVSQSRPDKEKMWQRNYGRVFDWLECWEGGKANVFRVRRYAFVHAYDISLDPLMPERLKQMIAKGILSGNRMTGTHVRVPRPEEYLPINGNPLL